MSSGHQWAGWYADQSTPSSEEPSLWCLHRPAHLASGSRFTWQSAGNHCLPLMMMHPRQSDGNWELVVLPTQPGSSAHPPKLPCPEPMCSSGTSTGDRKGWSKLPRLLISLNYQLRSSKRRFAWNSWPLLTFLFVQKWAVFAMSQHVLCVLTLHLQKNPSAKGRAGNAEWAPLSRRRYILNK